MCQSRVVERSNTQSNVVVVQGTSSFIAVEVHGQSYLFTPGRSPPTNVVKGLSRRYPLLPGDDEPGDETGLVEFPEEVDVPALPSFSFSPLHDLESMWWLAGYFTFDFSSRLLEKYTSHKDKKETGHTARLCFPTELFEEYIDRNNVMTTTGNFASYAYILPECLRPAGAALEKFRRELTARYTKTEESSESAATPAFDGLHEMLATMMRTIADVAVKAQQEQELFVKKRARNDGGKASAAPTEAKRPRVE